MSYFVTGATGFIGRFLVAELLKRPGRIYVLCRAGSAGKLDALRERWGDDAERVVPVIGDLSKPFLGVDAKTLAGKIDHFFHLAAIYDLTAPAEEQRVANVDGTRNAMGLAEALGVKCFHHVSSIAAAGLYPGTFTEEMFEEAREVEHNPYYRTKHESEGVVRRECRVPWRVYRTAIVVGHSETGEIDKIDGPYFFFKTLHLLGSKLPSWAAGVGLEGGQINLVPVDYVAKAMDHIAHVPGLDRKAFHLSDPNALTVGRMINVFARVAGAPTMALRIDTTRFDYITRPLRTRGTLLPVIKQITDAVLEGLGIPRELLEYLNYPTRFDTSGTVAALAGSGISLPLLESYAAVLWEYWERHYAPRPSPSPKLRRAVQGRTALVTGASSGIGRATALRIGAAGGTVLLVARSRDKLDETRAEIEGLGGKAYVHTADLSNIADIERLGREVLAQHGRVDILINNAGRSIRRSIALSYDRFHDFERTMQLNYFGPVRLVLSLMPEMRKASADGRRGGHIVNVSSIGVQTNPPRFSAYVASKAALDAFSTCISSEIVDDHVHVTTVHMPLVRTPMIAPTKLYDRFPAITPNEAADMICSALVTQPKKVATALGNLGQISRAVTPPVSDIILNTAYHVFPDSKAAREGGGERPPRVAPLSLERLGWAFSHLMRGIHW